MISWYVIYTRRRAEERALENLLRQGYQAYLPRYRRMASHACRSEAVLRPLFPRYLFAGLDRAKRRWRPILPTFGIVDVARVAGEPEPAAAEIIPMLREREASGLFDRVPTQQPLRLGELVRVTRGAFEAMVGRLVELRDQDRVVVLLDLLGRGLRAQFDLQVVEAA